MRKLAVLGVIVGSLALVCGLTAEWLKSFDGGAVTPIVATSSADVEVTALGQIATNRVWDGEPIPVRLTFRNRSAAEVKGLRVAAVLHPGLHLKTPLESINLPLGEPLAPGAIRDARLIVVPRKTSGQYTFAVRYDWENSAGLTNTGTVSAGPLVVASRGRTLVTKVGAPVIALFKDLALPIVLAIGAWLLQRQEKVREERRTSRDTMLPVSHRFNTEHYLPLLRSISQFDREVMKGDAPSSRRDLLFDLMLLARLVRHIGNKIGGLFLKDLKAEEVVTAAWRLFFLQMQAWLDPTTSDAVLEVMSPREGRAAFKARFPREGASTHTPIQNTLLELETQFTAWELEKLRGEALPVLRVMHRVLLHELNRPFESWYEGDLEFPAKDLKKRVEELKALEPADTSTLSDKDHWKADIAELRKDLEQYIERRTRQHQEGG